MMQHRRSNTMPRKPPDEPKGGFKRLAAALGRQRDTVVPPAFQFLWENARFIVPYGGRSSAKSWSIARVLLVMGHEAPLRVLCCREIQSSIKESAYRLLADQVEMLGLSDFYEVGADSIEGKNGTRFFFEGLRYNTSRIRSIEGVTTVWVEEAQSVSDMSWETLLPTVRKAGSRFFISFNPMAADDPVMRRFVEHTPPRTIVRKVSYLDNPYFSAESEAERAWLEQTDADAYRHVWLGYPRTVSDAQILRGKYFAEPFEISPSWSGPHHGLDFGFSADPSAAVRCYIDDASRTLYVSHEYWKLREEIDALPDALEYAIPGISRHVVHADSARPETVSYLQRHGIPNCRSAAKWSGSVDDGIMFLRSFSRIVIDPSCKHLLDECARYSFKCDRLTGLPLPEPLDAHNHCVDSLRYALSPLIRSQPSSSFFSRSALLVKGSPVEPPVCSQGVFGVLATSPRAGSAAGLVIFSTSPADVAPRLIVCDWDLVEIDEAMSIAWLQTAQQRVTECAKTFRMLSLQYPGIYVECDDLGLAIFDLCDDHASRQHSPETMINVCKIERDQGTPIPQLDDLAASARPVVNGGQRLKFSAPALARQVTHRATSTNHLFSQILSYQPGVKDMPQELTTAFCIGIDLWQPGHY
jgi:phage terminase large subunit